VESIPAGRAVSFELDVFPTLVGNGLYGYEASGYWIDIGTPARYLEATWDLLAGRVESDLPERDESGSLIYENCITAGAVIGPQSVLGRHCSVGVDSRVERSVVFEGTIIRENVTIRESVLGARVRVGEGARIGPRAIIGDEAVVADGAEVPEDARVEPGEMVE
jgi:mannose-1-phosphate guanylyltransferase